MTKWGEFQSLIQISIGLNAAYFSISQFVHHDVVGERSRLAQAAKYADEHLKAFPDIRNKLRELDRLIATQVDDDRTALLALRIASVVLFFLGLLLLWLSSIWAGDDLTNPVVYYGAPLLNLPFVFGILYMLVVAAPSYNGISSQRDRIEKDMREKAAQVPVDRLLAPVVTSEIKHEAPDTNNLPPPPPPAPDMKKESSEAENESPRRET